MIERFNPRPANKIDQIERHTDTMALVSAAAQEAVTELAVRYGLDAKLAGELDAAAKESFASYVTTGESVAIHDIKMMAFDAVEFVLRQHGYTEDEYGRYFLSEMNAILGHPDVEHPESRDAAA